MLRLILILLSVYGLTSCAVPDPQQMGTATGQFAVAKARLLASKYFLKKYGARVDAVLAGLAAEGGFLDNPLVKILLPPPVGLLVDVGQAFYENPQAALLDTLINRAAGQVTPLASPVLRTALEEIILNDKAEALLSGDETAVTDYLRRETAAVLQEALLPEVSAILAHSGADELYAELTEIAATVEEINASVGEAQAALNGKVPESEPTTLAGSEPVKLEAYVTDKAIEGIFRVLGQEERQLRSQLP